MSYLTSIPQATDKWHCRLVPDDSWDGENPPEQPMICDENYELLPNNIIKTGELDGSNIYLSTKEIPEGSLLGNWSSDGNFLDTISPDFDVLVPVGNTDGVSTDQISYHGYQGHAMRKRQDTVGMHEYPADTQPFALRITRTKTTDDSWPHIPWGWTVEMLSDDPLRDITARAIGVYDENDVYKYTTGAFVLMDFEEEDAEGNPITVQRYGTICPVGQRTADADTVYFKLLLGSAPEGAWELTDTDDGATQTRLFWGEDQPVAPGAGEWVLTQTVTNGMAGTVCLTSPDNSEIPNGSLVRIDGTESTVTSLWNTGGIVLDPYLAYASGLPIEVWE